MILFKVDMCCACGMHTADTSHQQQMLIADGEIACTVIGDPAPAEGFWSPFSVFGIPHQTGNLASPCKIP